MTSELDKNEDDSGSSNSIEQKQENQSKLCSTLTWLRDIWPACNAARAAWTEATAALVGEPSDFDEELKIEKLQG